jgi:hypothetical protein
LTLIQRALDELDIELILALSPQAKGRVERLFKTLQDRLIKEMRVMGIATMDEANRFLEEVFIPFWNERFGVEPREPVDAHRALPEGADLLRIFADTDQRVIDNDFTFRYKNRFYQIDAHDADGAMPKSKITIEECLDGTTRFRWRAGYVLPTPFLARPPKVVAKNPEPEAPPVPRVSKPAADHPWRRFPLQVGKKQFTSPAPRTTLSTPRPQEVFRSTS